MQPCRPVQEHIWKVAARVSSAWSRTAFVAALSLEAMVGTADLVRLERVKTWATARAELADRRTTVVSTRPAAKAGGMAWPLYVPAENRPVYVSVGEDAVTAGRVDLLLRGQPALSGKALRFAVDGGTVKVYLPDAAPAVMNAARQVQGVQGVRALTMQVM